MRWALLFLLLALPVCAEEQYLPALVATPTVFVPDPTPTRVPCCGDCDGDHVVTISELVRAVDFALGHCP